MSHTPSPFREYLVQIVDSIMALFRVDFSGRGELSERQQKVCIVSIVFFFLNAAFQLAQVPEFLSIREMELEKFYRCFRSCPSSQRSTMS